MLVDYFPVDVNYGDISKYNHRLQAHAVMLRHRETNDPSHSCNPFETDLGDSTPRILLLQGLVLLVVDYNKK